MDGLEYDHFLLGRGMAYFQVRMVPLNPAARDNPVVPPCQAQ